MLICCCVPSTPESQSRWAGRKTAIKSEMPENNVNNVPAPNIKASVLADYGCCQASPPLMDPHYQKPPRKKQMQQDTIGKVPAFQFKQPDISAICAGPGKGSIQTQAKSLLLLGAYSEYLLEAVAVSAGDIRSSLPSATPCARKAYRCCRR